jgi:hypothetical protein
MALPTILSRFEGISQIAMMNEIRAERNLFSFRKPHPAQSTNQRAHLGAGRAGRIVSVSFFLGRGLQFWLRRPLLGLLVLWLGPQLPIDLAWFARGIGDRSCSGWILTNNLGKSEKIKGPGRVKLLQPGC